MEEWGREEEREEGGKGRGRNNEAERRIKRRREGDTGIHNTVCSSNMYSITFQSMVLN